MPKPLDSRTGEALVALCLLVIGCLAVALAWNMPSGTLALPGPRIFPTAVGTGMAVVALMLLASLVRERASRQAIEIGHRDVLTTFAALVGAALGFERIGALPTFALFLFILLRALARLSWWQALAAALVGTGAAWILFVLVLGVRLPG